MYLNDRIIIFALFLWQLQNNYYYYFIAIFPYIIKKPFVKLYN